MEEGETLLDLQHSPTFKLKRKGLMITLFLFYVLSGLEYSITIPSALLDGKYSAQDRSFMLTEVGLYPLSGMLSCLFLGHLYDRTKHIRVILISSAVLEIIGNLVYAINCTKWLSLIGRFVAGLGDGFIPISIAEITYLYEEHDRVGMICLLELGRIIGFMNGPVVNYFIVKWSKVHTWKLHNKTLPGYVMGWSWAALTLIAVCCLHNLALEIIERFDLNDSPFMKKSERIYSPGKLLEYDDEEEEEDFDDEEDENRKEKGDLNPFDDDDDFDQQQEETTHQEDYNSEAAIFGAEFQSGIDTQPEEEKESLVKKNKEDIALDGSVDKDIFPSPPKRKFNIKEKLSSLCCQGKYDSMKEKVLDDASDIFNKSYINEIFHIEIALLMVMNFVFWYSQTTFFMFASYTTSFEYKWGPVTIGLTYVTGFVVVVVILLIMFFMKEFVSKKNIYFIVTGLACIQISLGLLIYEQVPPDPHKRVIVFLVATVLLFLSVPCSLVCFKTLVTNLVRPGMQGTLQGITSSIVRLSIIAGLLLSIVTVHDRQVYASVMTVFCFATIIFFFLAFELITRRQKESKMKFTY